MDADYHFPWRDLRRLMLRFGIYFFLLAIICWIAHALFLNGVRAYQDSAVWITEAKRSMARAGDVTRSPGEQLIIVLGDSRLLAAFDPVRFDAATAGRTRSYNFALPASTSGVHLHLLRELLDSGVRPDRILLGFSAFSPGRMQVKDYRSVGVGSVREVATMAVEPRGPDVVQDWLLPLKRFQKAWMQMLNTRLFHPDRDVHLQESRRAFLAALSDRRGAFPNRSNEATREARMTEPNFLDVDVQSDPATTAILDLAGEYGIPVTLIRPPVRPTTQIGADRLASEFPAIAEAHPGVSVSGTALNPVVLPVEEFADLVHVTADGARSFTDRLAEEWPFGAGEDGNQ